MGEGGKTERERESESEKARERWELMSIVF